MPINQACHESLFVCYSKTQGHSHESRNVKLTINVLVVFMGEFYLKFVKWWWDKKFLSPSAINIPVRYLSRPIQWGPVYLVCNVTFKSRRHFCYTINYGWLMPPVAISLSMLSTGTFTSTRLISHKLYSHLSTFSHFFHMLIDQENSSFLAWTE